MVTAILFLVAMFTPFHGSISLVAAGIVVDYILRVVGVMMFKTMEILGKRMAKSSKGKSCTKLMRKGGQDDDNQDSYFARSRTTNSSATAVNESSPLPSNGQFTKALQNEYRVPGAPSNQ